MNQSIQTNPLGIGSGSAGIVSGQVSTPAWLRPARLHDVPDVVALLAAAVPNCVARTERAIRDELSSYVIAATPMIAVAACGSLGVVATGVGEVRAIAVSDEARGLGLGSVVVQRLLDEARWMNLGVVRCITRHPAFFEKLGFERVTVEPRRAIDPPEAASRWNMQRKLPVRTSSSRLQIAVA